MSSVGPNSCAAESSHAGLGGFAHTGAGAGTPTTAHDKIRPGDETGAESALVFCNIPLLNRINSILIPPSCNFFSGSPPAKNSGVKRAWHGAISGWVTDREVFPGVQSEDKNAQKRLGLVCRARL
jgi:hypothetical protein